MSSSATSRLTPPTSACSSFRVWPLCCLDAGLFTKPSIAESILQKMLWAYTIYSAALTPVVLAAFYSKRVTAWGAVAAIAGGTVVTLAWDLPGVKALFPHIISDRDAIFPALFIAVAALIIVSLFTAPPRESQLAQFAE